MHSCVASSEEGGAIKCEDKDLGDLYGVLPGLGCWSKEGRSSSAPSTFVPQTAGELLSCSWKLLHRG
jgi:hypothetical protein